MSPAESHACVWCLNVLGPLVLEACLVLCNLQPTALKREQPTPGGRPIRVQGGPIFPGIESGKAPPPVCKTPPRPVRIDGAVVCLGTLLHEFLGNVPLAPSWSCN
ncbi:hypothetical protein H9L39_04724 [Fusarium oxysporum f. sp. albedinis]|nr:hypothetical protein H9L39_04724 [Fusarium oxysporum f. sp. albedinis]